MHFNWLPPRAGLHRIRSGRSMTNARTLRQRATGQALVEFAIVAPVLLLLVLVALDFGRMLYGWVVLQNSARIAANYAGLYPEGWETPGDAAIVAEYETLIETDLNTANCSAAATPPSPVFSDGPDFADPAGPPDTAYDVGDSVRVDLACTFSPLTPIVSSIVGANLQLAAGSTFRIRSGDITGLPDPTQMPRPGGPPPGGTPTCPTGQARIPSGIVGGTVADARGTWNSTFTGGFDPATGQNGRTVTGYMTSPGDTDGDGCVPTGSSMTVTT